MHTPAYLEGRVLTQPRADLDPLERTLAVLGHPERVAPTVLITGTNGKGSTQAFLAAILGTAGHPVATFSSPSLEDFHEQIRISGAPLAPSRGALLAEEVLRAAPEPLTLFETATAMAFLAFARAGACPWVLEVGWGGRRDATNLADPCLSVLTRVALEHTEQLGATVQAIAEEKAGVGRPGRPLLTAEAGAALTTLESLEPKVGYRLERLGRDFEIGPSMLAGSPHRWRFASQVSATEELVFEDLCLGLRGPHQAENAALAVQAALRLTGLGVPVSLDDIRVGLEQTKLAGRLERLGVVQALPVWVDGAHNPDGLQALLRALPDLEPGGRPVVLISIFADKAVDQMLSLLADQASALVCVNSGAARALPSHALAERARRRLPGLPVLQAEDLREGLRLAVREGGDRGAGAILACGTLSLVEPLRRAVHASAAG